MTTARQSSSSHSSPAVSSSPTLRSSSKPQFFSFQTVDNYLTFVTTVPGAFGAVWALFAATDAIIYFMTDQKVTILFFKPVMAIALVCASMGGLGGWRKYRNMLQEKLDNEADVDHDQEPDIFEESDTQKKITNVETEFEDVHLECTPHAPQTFASHQN